MTLSIFLTHLEAELKAHPEYKTIFTEMDRKGEAERPAYVDLKFKRVLSKEEQKKLHFWIIQSEAHKQHEKYLRETFESYGLIDFLGDFKSKGNPMRIAFFHNL